MTSYHETDVGKILDEIKEEHGFIDSEVIDALFYRPSVNGMDKFEFYKAIRQLTDKVWLYTYGNYKVKE